MFHRCFFYTLVEPYLNEVYIRENITAAFSGPNRRLLLCQSEQPPANPSMRMP